MPLSASLRSGIETAIRWLRSRGPNSTAASMPSLPRRLTTRQIQALRQYWSGEFTGTQPTRLLAPDMETRRFTEADICNVFSLAAADLTPAGMRADLPPDAASPPACEASPAMNAEQTKWPELTPEEALVHQLNRIECFARDQGLTGQEIDLICAAGMSACCQLRPDIAAKFNWHHAKD